MSDKKGEKQPCKQRWRRRGGLQKNVFLSVTVVQDPETTGADERRLSPAAGSVDNVHNEGRL